MKRARNIAVVDIGKTNAKVALVDLPRLAETSVRRAPNGVVRDGIYPHVDADRIFAFVLQSLRELNEEQPIDAICVAAHGATAALLDHGRGLALPILDYEHDGPDSLAQEYDRVRPPFEVTGTPRLPAGLNLGAQLFWQASTYPQAFDRVAAIVMYPQYWASRLSGVLSNEVTSLGCHTDLWDIRKGDLSPLIDSLGWRGLMAPLRGASDRLGPVLPQIASLTGLDEETPVYCGIHDSNASLLPHLLAQDKPFAVVSSGTWVIAMSVGSGASTLDPSRDTLVNVSAFGEPVPSARFMGGREFETLIGGQQARAQDADVEAVLTGPTMLMPSVQTGSGPFPTRAAHWIGGEPSAGRRYVVASFYLAMMTATSLDLIGARGPTIIEGPFALNPYFLGMLAAARSRPVMAAGDSATGTSIGAALLAADQATLPAERRNASTTCPSPRWAHYAEAWRAACQTGPTAAV